MPLAPVPAPPFEPLIYTGRVRAALRLMARAHAGVNRKSGDIPYMLHPVAVAQILAAAGAPEYVICAALLHDVDEDTLWSLADIQDQCGYDAALLVAYLTKVDEVDGRKLTSAEKNAITLETFACAPLDAAAGKAGDLIANLSDLIFDRRQHGDDHWQELFGAKADQKIAHYLRLADLLIDRLTATRYDLVAWVLRERANTIRSLHGSGGVVDHDGQRIVVPLVYSGRVRRALHIAERAHRGDLRRGSDDPFIVHPVAVAQILAHTGAGDDVICAAYCDDAVEEGSATMSLIQDELGQRPAEIVGAVTKPAVVDGQRLSSAEKDRRAVAAMAACADDDVLALKGADTTANMTDLADDHHRGGRGRWTALFGERADEKLDYYAEMAATLSARLDGHPTYAPIARMLSTRRAQLRCLRTA